MTTRHVLPVCLVLVLILTTACAPGARRTNQVAAIPEAAPDTTSFAGELAAHLALPADAQEATRARAEQMLAGWRDFEHEAAASFEAGTRRWWTFGGVDQRTFHHVGTGLGNSLLDLRDAVAVDPGFAEAWGAMGHLCLVAGDLESGRRYLERARLAAAAQRGAGRPLAPADELRIHRDLAWALRDLARWDDGLAATDRGLARFPGDQELTLVRGLLLAGAGRFSEAMSVAVRLEPLTYPRIDFTFIGLRRVASSFANNWIRSQAYLAQGDVAMAHEMLGDLDLYAFRSRLPLAERYWRDTGLVAELAGDEQAPLWYALGYITRPYEGFYPVMMRSMAPQVLDLPDTRMPVYTSFGSRFYCGGSPLTYAALQMNEMALSIFPEQHDRAAGHALQMIRILERRGLVPGYCHALRGRIAFADEAFATAEQELGTARALFAADGRVDPVTSMMLGLLALQAENHARADTLLTEAVAADPRAAPAWRALGVARAKRGDRAGAARALDEAVRLEPGNVAGYYNRGLFRLQNRSFGAAASDLAVAYRLDPDNREVQRLLQMAVGGARAAGEVASVHEGPPPDFDPSPDAVLAELERKVEELFTLPDSLRADDAAADARIVELEHAYAADGDPGLRQVLALAYLDHGRYAEAQLLLGPGWGLDLSPEEELMLLYADRQLGEAQRAEELARSLVAGEAGDGNPYLWALAAQIVRNDPRLGSTYVDNDFLHYAENRDAKSYGTTHGWEVHMTYGFDNTRWYRLNHGIPQAPPMDPWFRKNFAGKPADGAARVKDGQVK